MANEENLKPFKKGKDPRRNLDGRPKGSRSRSTIIREHLETWIDTKDPFTGEMVKVQVVDAMVLSMLRECLKKGSVQAFKELMDSGYGKIVESHYSVNVESGMTPEELRKEIERVRGLDGNI